MVHKNILLCLTGFVCSLSVGAQTSTFTYQGRLTDGAAPASGTYQMEFRLYDALTAGAQIGTTVTNNSVTVTNGIFTVNLDFSPATPFATGADRWLEVAVRKSTDPPGFITLSPRQKITSAPYAIMAGKLAPGAAPSVENLNNLGSLRWDLLRAQSTFTVAANPTGIAFDGENIWITHPTPGPVPPPSDRSQRDVGNRSTAAARINAPPGVTITKLRASDGATVGTLAVGNSPTAIAFDGANMWIANGGDTTVTKVRASDGATLGSFTVGTTPAGIAFDGANVWVTRRPANSIAKLRASDGANLGTFPVGFIPSGVAFDGANIWVAAESDGVGSNGVVTRLRASDGACVGTCSFLVSLGANGIAYDGVNFWVTHTGGQVTKISADGTILTGVFGGSAGVAFDGVNIWAARTSTNSVVQTRISDGTVNGFTVGTAPKGVAFGGGYIWVANSGSNTVTRLRAF